jgi:hypothetical protein
MSRQQDCRQNLHQSGLPRTIRTQESMDLTLSDLQIDTFESDHLLPATATLPREIHARQITDLDNTHSFHIRIRE